MPRSEKNEQDISLPNYQNIKGVIKLVHTQLEIKHAKEYNDGQLLSEWVFLNVVQEGCGLYRGVRNIEVVDYIKGCVKLSK